jgi:hypothetical protein
MQVTHSKHTKLVRHHTRLFSVVQPRQGGGLPISLSTKRRDQSDLRYT